MATVLPRMLSFLLVLIHTKYLDGPIAYGRVSILFAWIIVFNVILAYGMETSFFRFINSNNSKNRVTSTSAISILVSTLVFVGVFFIFKNFIASLLELDVEFIVYVLGILALDALVIIPFANLRADERPLRYSIIKIINVLIYVGLNIFFLVILPEFSDKSKLFSAIFIKDFQVQYIFISNLIASAFTFILMFPFYFKMEYHFDKKLWNRMIIYGLPILVSGLAFAINEHFDKILLEWIIGGDEGLFDSGAYSACYKLALFMTLFATAFRLGVEPFFFSHANDKNAPETYAVITRYFVALGCLILIGVITFSDFLKEFMIRNSEYWIAMSIVPIILLANLCLGIYHNLSVWYKITDRTKFGAYISFLGAIITLILNVILIPHYSYLGSAIATLAAYGVMMVVSWYLGRKYYPIPYDMIRICLYLITAIVFSAISFYVAKGNYWISIPLLLVFLVILFTSEKRELKQLFNK